MSVLRVIGSFFAKIWRWIKNTAWVQPLLIVGVIFGVIFSIPSITSSIQGWINNANSAQAYFNGYKKSLEGGADSSADKLIDNILKKQIDSNIPSEYSNKYFITFVAETCSTCNDVKAGFKVLQENWKSTYIPNDGLDFNLITIFTDEVTSQTTVRESAFVQFMNRNSYFFEEAGQVGRESYYYLNGNLSDDSLSYLESADPEEFVTPTILLIDFGVNGEGPGISQVMFGVTGDSDYDKAQLLLDCWNGTGKFSEKNSN